MSDLKPCPFCGASAMVIRRDIFQPTEDRSRLVSCVAKSCANRTSVRENEAAAIAAWNRRKVPNE